MVYLDLILSSIIMIMASVLNQSSEATQIQGKGQTIFSYNRAGVINENVQTPYRKNFKKRAKSRHRRNWYMNPIMIQLNIVMSKYEQREAEMEVLYSEVKGCGYSKCEKFRGLIPENQLQRHIKCKPKGFKKMSSELILNFYKGVQILEYSFQTVINFNKLRIELGGRKNRIRILEEFKIALKKLKGEIELAVKNKMIALIPENFILSAIPPPRSSTDLILYEWRIYQASKRFLQDWQKNLRKLFRCWKKNKRHQELKKKKQTESI